MAIKDSTLRAKQIIDQHPNACLVDVREEEEYLAGHIEGALLLPVDDIDALTASDVIPSKTTEVLLYCRSGARSKLAAERLAGLGYENIYDLGGLTGWPYGLVSGWF
jgi:rhodanese-related sulfurtransferase